MADRRRDRSALSLSADDLDRAVCLDPSALSPPLTARIGARQSTLTRPVHLLWPRRNRTFARGASASTGLPVTLDSNCDHTAIPDANNAGGMWRQCGICPRPPCPLSTATNCVEICTIRWLTRPRGADYIAPTTARRSLFERDGAPAKHLTDSGDQTSDFGRVLWA